MSFSESENEESFINLSVYLHNLSRTNHRSYTNIKIDVIDRFQIYFVAIGCVVSCLLHVIFIGSVSLRGDHLNIMFITVSMNGNNMTLHIAFSLGMINNVDFCTWFLMRLKEAFREGREVLFITNMDDVTNFCIGQDLCLDDIQLIYHVYFEQNLCQLTHDAHEVLVNIGHAKWARTYFPNIRWNILKIDIP
uniref:Uncharacterized protein n=1 Tax=Lactuca sativa TaxID=4236 RepID=A0A9R1WAZ1_LACSA|nr:hypothetical protein LSAT_V11C300112980 [Lactuca sativa]